MTQYTSYWLRATTTGTSTATDKASNAASLIKLTLTPHGHGEHARWMRQEARTCDRQFETVEDLSFDADGGPQAVLQRFVELRQSLASSAWEEIVFEDTFSSLVLFPTDVQQHRPKTDDERHMDLAALHTECSDYHSALAALQGCRHSAQDWYWHTAARRIHANRARANPGPEAGQDWTAAVEHAVFILSSAAEQPAGHDVPVYGFGDSYNKAAGHVAAAAQTLAEYLLCIAHQPEQALAAIGVGDATNYGTQQLRQFKVTALMQLGRHTEAYETHLQWTLRMPEVLQSEGYRAFVQQTQAATQDAQALRVGQLQFAYASGSPASPSELVLLRQHFPGLSDAYVQWITHAEQHHLSVVDGEQEETYGLFSVQEALDKHGELMGWLRLHDDSSPELAQEIHGMIAESGIDPLRMLPIVGDAQSSDCFLLRTDGPDAGTIYFWAHDECTIFSPVVRSADQLFPWLRAQAEAGSTFVL